MKNISLKLLPCSLRNDTALCRWLNEEAKKGYIFRCSVFGVAVFSKSEPHEVCFITDYTKANINPDYKYKKHIAFDALGGKLVYGTHNIEGEIIHRKALYVQDAISISLGCLLVVLGIICMSWLFKGNDSYVPYCEWILHWDHLVYAPLAVLLTSNGISEIFAIFAKRKKKNKPSVTYTVFALSLLSIMTLIFLCICDINSNMTIPNKPHVLDNSEVVAVSKESIPFGNRYACREEVDDSEYIYISEYEFRSEFLANVFCNSFVDYVSDDMKNSLVQLDDIFIYTADAKLWTGGDYGHCIAIRSGCNVAYVNYVGLQSKDAITKKFIDYILN